MRSGSEDSATQGDSISELCASMIRFLLNVLLILTILQTSEKHPIRDAGREITSYKRTRKQVVDR